MVLMKGMNTMSYKVDYLKGSNDEKKKKIFS